MGKNQTPTKIDIDLSMPDMADLDFDLRFTDPHDDSSAAAEPGGTLVEDFGEELDDAARAVKAYYKQSYERQRQITDSGYYFCVCFQTADQVRQFLAAVGWEDGQVAGARFLNGLALARKLGVKLERTDQEPKRMPPRPRFLDHALEVETCEDEEVSDKRPSGNALQQQTVEPEPNADRGRTNRKAAR